MPTPRKNAKVIPLRAARASSARSSSPAARGPVIGRLVHASKGGFSVDYPGNTLGALQARTVVSPVVLSRACRDGVRPEVILAFEEERADRPVILGLVHAEPKVGSAGRAGMVQEPQESPEALIDGKRVVLEGKDEIVLKCGKALLVMRRNGRIVVRGTHIETDSEGVNRVAGMVVEIN